MDRNGLEKYIAEVYSTDAEFPWASYPDYMVFQQRHNVFSTKTNAFLA